MSTEIKTESGAVVGQWNGESADDLLAELNRIFKQLRADGSKDKVAVSGIPHEHQIPDDLKDFKAYRLWGCDRSGVCVVGAKADRTESADKIRAYLLDQDNRSVALDED